MATAPRAWLQHHGLSRHPAVLNAASAAAAKSDTLRCLVNRRPKLTIVAPNASPEEAAAVVAAVERFMRETVPAPAPPPARRNPWQEAALREGVGRAPQVPLRWE